MEIQEILDAFQIHDGIYKRKLVDAAVKLKDEIIPHLIAVKSDENTWEKE